MATAGVGLGSLAVGAVGGNVLGNAIGRAANGNDWKEQGAAENITTIQKALSGAVGIIALESKNAGLISQDSASSIFNFAKSIVGLGDAAEEADKKAGPAKSALDSAFASKNVQDWIDFNKQKEQADEDFKAQSVQIEQDTKEKRLGIIAEFGQQAAEAEGRYTKSRAGALEKFAQSQRDSEAAYYRERANAAAGYSIEVQRMEEDHQRQMRQMAIEHEGRMDNLAGSRDALGLVKEQQSYEKSRSEAEDNYKLEASRKSEDFARQMSDMEANYRIQQDMRLRDFREQQAAAEQQHREEMAAIEKNKQEQLSALDKNQADLLTKAKEGYDAQVATMQTAFNDRLNAMSESIKGDTAAFQKYMQEQSEEFQKYLSAFQGNGIPPIHAKANGGPVSALAPYLVGEQGPELFIPKNAGSIVPNGLTAAMLQSARGGTGSRSTVNNQFSFGGFTMSQAHEMITANNAQLREAILQDLAEAF